MTLMLASSDWVVVMWVSVVSPLDRGITRCKVFLLVRLLGKVWVSVLVRFGVGSRVKAMGSVVLVCRLVTAFRVMIWLRDRTIT